MNGDHARGTAPMDGNSPVTRIGPFLAHDVAGRAMNYGSRWIRDMRTRISSQGNRLFSTG